MDQLKRQLEREGIKVNARIMPALEYIYQCMSAEDYIKIDIAMEFYNVIRRAIPKKDRDVLDQLLTSMKEENEFTRTYLIERRRHIRTLAEREAEINKPSLHLEPRPKKKRRIN